MQPQTAETEGSVNKAQPRKGKKTNGKATSENTLTGTPSVPEPVPVSEIETLDTKPTVIEPNDARPSLFVRAGETNLGLYPGGTYFYASQLTPMPNYRDWNDPDDLDAIARLAELIAENLNAGGPGILEPIQYVPGDYREGDRVPFHHGETRWRSVLFLEGEEYAPSRFNERRFERNTIRIPAVPWSEQSDEKRHLDLLARNTHRPYKDVQLARWMAHMQEQHGYTQDQIAAALGKPHGAGQSWVSQILALNSAPDKLIEYVKRGLIKPTTVVTVMRDYGDRAEQLVVQVVEKKLHQIEATEHKDPMVLDLPLPSTIPTSSRTRSTPSSAPTEAGSPRPPSPTRSRNRSSKAANPAKVSRREIDQQAGSLEWASVSETNYNTLLEAVRHAATYCPDPDTREAMNKALIAVGLDTIDYQPAQAAA